jgi:GNAT superfamily N-acetyltransferase
MEIQPFQEYHIPQAAALFIENFKLQREAVPSLPERMEDPQLVEEMIARRMAACGGLALVEGERLLGYLGWYISGSFRDTGRKGSYVPEWGHAAAADRRASIYRRLYRRAAEIWTESGCQVHAITLLAADRDALETWFWNGFGLTVVDALRSMDLIHAPAPVGLSLVRAVPADAGRVAEIEAEHWRHYSSPPIYMAVNLANTGAELQELLQDPRSSIWMALDGDQVAAYVRFEPPDSVAIANTDDTIWIKGAYTRPEYRGRGAMPALIDAGLDEYRQRGFARCGVDFESFNPEAAVFWPRYFEPIGLSVVRVPEKIERPA